METNSPSTARKRVDHPHESAAAHAPTPAVHRLFEQRADAHPERTALLFGDESWTYDRLNREANQLAHRLDDLGVGPEDPVGVYVSRSPQLVASLLGVLKAGGAYVALDPTIPSERLQYIVDDADVEVVVGTGSNHRDWGARTIVDISSGSTKQQPESNPEGNVRAGQLAYILYTSGTTGTPKGVMQTHRALSHHVQVFGNEIADITQDRTFLFKASYTFDLSISELFPPLIAGARVAIAKETGHGADRLAETIQARGVTDLFLTPTRLRLLIDREELQRCESLTHVYSAGEALQGNLRDEFLDRFDASLFNLYGTTEMCCGQTGLNCRRERGKASVTSIGHAWAGYDAYILDDDLEPVEVDTSGELVVAGTGEARGYLGNPRETALRFVPDALSGRRGGRLYRSGDVARRNADDQIEYLGREDGQLQVLGVRIERSEVEATLAEADEIDLAAVRPVRERAGKADGLVGYVVPHDGQEPDASVLRDWMEGHVPRPAIPQYFCVLSEMPLRPSGKIDYSALPDPDTFADRHGERIPPETPTQRRLADLWQTHLDVEEVGIHENFFRVGGHSLLAVRIQHEIANAFGVEVPLETVLTFPTIAELAHLLEGREETTFEPIEPLEYGDEVPLSASQRRMWFLQKLNPDSVAYNVPAVIRLNRHVDLNAFRRALTRLVQRHEVLRTVYPERDGTPVQKILPPPERVSWTVDDLSAADDAEAEARALIERRVRQPFDLTEEPPLRLSMIKTAEEQWLFGPIFHHVAIDEWTFRVLLDDLQALYEAERTDDVDGEPLLPSDAARASEWRDAHEVLHQDLSPDTLDDPTLNTTGWTSSYDGNPFSEAEMRDWLRGRVARLRQLDLGRTLEIGSGTGMLLFRLAPHADEYVGLDFSKEALDYVEAVREQLDRDLSSVSLVHGRADEVGGLEGHFDTIILNSVVQYFPDFAYLDTVLSAAAKKLRDPGTLYLGDIRDRRLAYAFHASVAREHASDETPRGNIREQAQTELERETELLVSPSYLARIAKGLPGISGIDFTLPPAAFSTEMSVFRYGAFLHARSDAPALVPDEVLGWQAAGLDLARLRSELGGVDGSLLVTNIPNGRVQEPLTFQRWLHREDDAPLSTYASTDLAQSKGLDPDAMRRVGRAAGYRVTVSPAGDPEGRYFDATFEPRSSTLPVARPLTPLTGEGTSMLAPAPAPPPPDSAQEPSLSLWKSALDGQQSTGQADPIQEDVGVSARSLQYADYALWQADKLAGDEYDEALDYWVDRLEDVPSRIDWPFDGIDRDGEFGPAESIELELSGDTASDLSAWAERQSTTMSVLFLAALGSLLSRYSGQQDMTVGLPVTNRDRPEFRDLVGILLNTIPFAFHVDRTLGFDDFLARLGDEWQQAMSRKWIPFEDIVEAVGAERTAGQMPLFDVMFTFVPKGRRKGRLGTLGEVETDPIEFDMPQALCPLFVIVTEREDGYRVRFRYDSSRFDATEVQDMTNHFATLLESALATPAASVGALDMLQQTERNLLTGGWANGPQIDVPDAPVHRLLEMKVNTHPDRIAIVSEEETWTYDTLDRRANRLAHRLREMGVKPGVAVGVHMDRSAPLVAVLLGVLKAGGAYVALPPSLPNKRLSYIVDDADVDITVTDDPSKTEFSEQLVDASVILSPHVPDRDPRVPIPSQALAYILYTSGTTGRPKGVRVSHRSVTDMAIVMKTHFPAGKNDAILQKTPYSFDVSVSEIFNPLTAGARLVMTSPGTEKDPQSLKEQIEEADVSILRMTPTELANLLQVEGVEQCDSIRRVFAAGEELAPAVRDKFHEVWGGAELVNLWGPTEACVYGSWWPCREESPLDEVPIGWPLSNTALFCLDDDLEPLPPGVQGELWTAGPGLAHGYNEMPRETALAFRPNPYADEPGARLYKTGDLVRWSNDGHLNFVGRTDNQIQLRGIRIELGEIEAHLERMPAVVNAAVRPIKGNDGRVESLVAYVVLNSDVEPDAAAFRAHLSKHLPKSVVPGRYVTLEEMPRTPSGKIDRQALPEPDTEVASPDDDHLRTTTEKLVAAIWRDVLEIETVGRHANFFEVGGNSLAAVRVHRRLERQFDKPIDLVHLFEHTTVVQLADFVEESDTTSAGLSPAQKERGDERRTRLQQQRRLRRPRGDDETK